MTVLAKNQAKWDTIGVVLITCFIFSLVGLAQKFPKIGHELPFPGRVFADFCVIMNFVTLSLVVWGRWAVLNGKKWLHRSAMKLALITSLLFLASYLLQHALVGETRYPQNVPGRGVYLLILVSHILASAISLPIILVTALRAIRGDLEGHKRIAKNTFWIWTFVSLSGIMIYVMISPHYPVS